MLLQHNQGSCGTTFPFRCKKSGCKSLFRIQKISSGFGSHGLAAYGAANAELDYIAEHALDEGVPFQVLSVRWGATVS